MASKKAKKFVAFLSVFKKQVELKATELTREVAEGIAEEARDILDTQRYNWTPLKEKYVKRKEREGLDTRILIATGELRDSIDWGEEAGKVWCGIPSDEIHSGSDLPMHILARIHELGTATIPPRPLWRPLLAKWMKQRRDLGRKYTKAAASAARKQAKV